MHYVLWVWNICSGFNVSNNTSPSSSTNCLWRWSQSYALPQNAVQDSNIWMTKMCLKRKYCAQLFDVLNPFNSFCSSNTIWCHISRSIMVPVMACCQMEPSHYVNQRWLIINGVLWLLTIWREVFKIWIHSMSLKNTHVKLFPPLS